ncbi:FAD-dependent oxidoreductase [Candidatus Woesearchaeota archaeon]|nr:FAD-dependent oxidoreductase [Candidatus Woesearchaeota archaeon]
MQTDVLIIGGGPAGIVTALTARKVYPSKKIVLVRQNKTAVIPCGIPYIFHRLQGVDQDTISDEVLTNNNIDLIIDKVLSIDVDNKKAVLEQGVNNDKEIVFDRLVLATGSKPVKIPIPGIDKQGVWFVKKDADYLKQLRQAVLQSKNVVIIGGGFIGVEIAEELSNVEGLNIHVVEKLPHCLLTSFDEEFALQAEELLKAKGVNIHTNVSVESIDGGERVTSVKLSDGTVLQADVVIVSIGAKPNIDLALKAGLKIGDYKAITVDEFMRTSIDYIFAVGDCCEKKDFFTGKAKPVMLASTACHEARIAGHNLYALTLHSTTGTIAAFSTFVNGTVFSSVGLTEQEAKRLNIEVVSTSVEVPNHHPGKLPGTKLIKLKALFSKTGALIGVQLSGPETVAELVNLISLAIQKELTVFDLLQLQVATHPLITPAPTVYPLIKAAQSVINRFESV